MSLNLIQIAALQKDKVEVDFVLERERRLVGFEVKAAATAKTDHTRGLKRLQEAAGAAFACGVILTMA